MDGDLSTSVFGCRRDTFSGSVINFTTQDYCFSAAVQLRITVEGLAVSPVGSRKMNLLPSPVTQYWSHAGSTRPGIGNKTFGTLVSSFAPGFTSTDISFPSMPGMSPWTRVDSI